MGKKRRTKEQKIIARLRRELSKRNRTPVQTETTVWERKTEPQKEIEKPVGKKTSEKLLFNYEPKLIKKEMIRTFILSLFFIGLIALLKLVFRL